MQLKRCLKCKIEKPLSDFHKAKRQKFGVQDICKECRRTPKAQQKIERLKLLPQGFKFCTKCNEIKPFSDFNKCKRGLFGLHSYCKLCINKQQKHYHNEHPEIAQKYRETHKKQLKKLKRDWDMTHSEERRNYKQENRDKSKNCYLIKTYGITLDKYKQMLEAQNGVCAICHLPETRKSKYNDYTLAVDHDHKTGKIRGLLCHGCNNCLGILKEDINIFQSAIDYLHNFGGLYG